MNNSDIKGLTTSKIKVGQCTNSHASNRPSMSSAIY